jgi:hypothetical protein
MVLVTLQTSVVLRHGWRGGAHTGSKEDHCSRSSNDIGTRDLSPIFNATHAIQNLLRPLAGELEQRFFLAI